MIAGQLGLKIVTLIFSGEIFGCAEDKCSGKVEMSGALIIDDDDDDEQGVRLIGFYDDTENRNPDRLQKEEQSWGKDEY